MLISSSSSSAYGFFFVRFARGVSGEAHGSRRLSARGRSGPAWLPSSSSVLGLLRHCHHRHYCYGNYKLNLLWVLSHLQWLSQIIPTSRTTKYDYEGLSFSASASSLSSPLSIVTGLGRPSSSRPVTPLLPLAIILGLICCSPSQHVAFADHSSRHPPAQADRESFSTSLPPAASILPLLYFITIVTVVMARAAAALSCLWPSPSSRLGVPGLRFGPCTAADDNRMAPVSWSGDTRSKLILGPGAAASGTPASASSDPFSDPHRWRPARLLRRHSPLIRYAISARTDEKALQALRTHEKRCSGPHRCSRTRSYHRSASALRVAASAAR